MDKKKTISNDKFKVIPRRLPTDVLPCNEQILQVIYFEKEKKESTFAEAVDLVAQETSMIWQNSASLPVITHCAISTRMNKLLEDFRKVSNANIQRTKYKENVNSFKVKMMRTSERMFC